MTRYQAALAALTLMLPTVATASVYRIDSDHSNVGFKVRHLMVSNVKGTFTKVSGAVDIDDRELDRSKVKVTIDAASIDTGVKKRDSHLTSPDFLDVGRFPTITFVSRRVERKTAGRLDLVGDLTIHGVTRQVVLDVDGISGESKDPMGFYRRGASAVTKINRKDFGLTWNKALETGGVAVGDEVSITIEIEMIKEVSN